MVGMDTLTDYSAAIRVEIEELVLRLMRGGKPYSRVTVGYMLNTHHGEPLYQNGDFINGLPVTIDRTNTRTVRVWYPAFLGGGEDYTEARA